MRDTHPNSLIDARIQAHWAVQVVGALGLTFGEAVSDFSHTSLEWSRAVHALVSQPVGDDRGFRAALRLADLTLLAPIGENVEELPLDGLTLSQAYDWLSRTVATHLGGSFRQPLNHFDHQVPDHPVAHGRPFSTEHLGHFHELDRWYLEAFSALATFSEQYPHASPVRCWPHHFDMATLIKIDPDQTGDEARTIGVGMSPGDQSYPGPYWYVTPWPYPPAELLPEIEHGAWHTSGWVGAVLLGSEIAEIQGVRNQEIVPSFLHSAVKACLALIT